MDACYLVLPTSLRQASANYFHKLLRITSEAIARPAFLSHRETRFQLVEPRVKSLFDKHRTARVTYNPPLFFPSPTLPIDGRPYKSVRILFKRSCSNSFRGSKRSPPAHPALPLFHTFICISFLFPPKVPSPECSIDQAEINP